MMRVITKVGALSALLILSGCSGLPLQQGRQAVEGFAAERGVALSADTGAEIPALIDREAAVRLALSRNPELRASLASLGFGAAAVYEAGRIANPMFELSRLDSDAAGGGRLETYRLVASFTDLLTMGPRRRLAETRFAALQRDVSAQALATAAAAQTAWLDYAAALDILALRLQVAEAGLVTAELAERFRRAGNLTPREYAELQATGAELAAMAIDAEMQAEMARAALAGVLAISAGDDWQIDGGLTRPPKALPSLDQLLAAADETRLDLAAARLRAEAQADQLGLDNVVRWIDNVELGGEREREPDGERLDGPTLSLPLPVFDTGRGRVARARASLAQNLANLQRLQVDIGNDLRLHYAQLTAAAERAALYEDALVPARQRAVREAGAQYNFMLIGVFELLAVKRSELDARQAHVLAVRDYWQAHVALGVAAGTLLAIPETAPLVEVPAETMPHGDGADHDHHGADDHSMHRDHGGAREHGAARHPMHHDHAVHEPVRDDASHDDAHDEHADDERPADASEDAGHAHEHGAAS